MRANGIRPETDSSAAVLHAVWAELLDRLPFPVGDAPRMPFYCDFRDMGEFHDAVDRWRMDVCPFLLLDASDLGFWLASGRHPSSGRRTGRQWHEMTRTEQAAFQAASAQDQPLGLTGWATPEGGDTSG